MSAQLEPIRSPAGPVADGQPADLVGSLPEPLRAGATLAMAVSGCDDIIAILLALAGQAVAAGPSHRLGSPRGDSWFHATPDLLLVDDPDGALGAALEVAMSPITGRIAGIIRKYEPLSPTRLRARWAEARERRIKLGAQIAAIDARLKSIDEHHKAALMPPGGWSAANADIDLGVKRKRLVAEAAPLALEESEMEFAMRPVVMVGGISPATVRRWPGLAFDGHVADVLAGGEAVADFLNGPRKDLGHVLHFIDQAGRGLGMFPLGEQQLVGASVSLLWRCGLPDAAAVLSHRALHIGPLAGRHLVLPAPDASGVDPSSRSPAEGYDRWSAHLSQLFTTRLCRALFNHVLDRNAMGAHGELREACASAAASGTLSPAARAHLRNLPHLALRLALGIHIAGRGQNQPEVSADAYALATKIARAASQIHLSTLEQFQPGQLEDGDPLDFEVAIMATKIRIRGSCTRRQLFRGYHRKRYVELEPILDSAIHRGLIVAEGDLLLAPPITDRPRVRASAEGTK